MAPIFDFAFAAVGVGHLLHAAGLLVAEQRDGAVPLILDALTASTCPGSVLTPSRLLWSGALLPAGAAAALILAPAEDESTEESGAIRARMALALALHAALSLATRTSALSDAWPKVLATPGPPLPRTPTC